MPKQFTLHQFFRNGTAGNWYKRMGIHLAFFMNGLRHQFFPGARFSVDEHVGGGGCDPVNHVEDFQHLFAFADYLREELFSLLNLKGGLGAVGGCVDDRFYLVNIEWFGNLFSSKL